MDPYLASKELRREGVCVFEWCGRKLRIGVGTEWVFWSSLEHLIADETDARAYVVQGGGEVSCENEQAEPAVPESLVPGAEASDPASENLRASPCRLILDPLKGAAIRDGRTPRGVSMLQERVPSSRFFGYLMFEHPAIEQ